MLGLLENVLAKCGAASAGGGAVMLKAKKWPEERQGGGLLSPRSVPGNGWVLAMLSGPSGPAARGSGPAPSGAPLPAPARRDRDEGSSGNKTKGDPGMSTIKTAATPSKDRRRCTLTEASCGSW